MTHSRIWIMGKYDLCVNLNYGWIWFMFKSKLWVGGTHTNKDTHRHINTMTTPGLGAGPSENAVYGKHWISWPVLLVTPIPNQKEREEKKWHVSGAELEKANSINSAEFNIFLDFTPNLLIFPPNLNPWTCKIEITLNVIFIVCKQCKICKY